MIDFKIEEVSQDIAVIQLNGHLDGSSRQYFFDCVEDMIREGTKQIVIECAGIGVISSGGLAALLGARRHAQKNGGRIFLTHLSSIITDVLEQTKLNRLFSVYPSTEELVSKLNKSEPEFAFAE